MNWSNYFFLQMKWDMLLAKRIIAPWTPSLKVAADTSNFLSWPDAEIPNKAPTREVTIGFCGQSCNPFISLILW